MLKRLALALIATLACGAAIAGFWNVTFPIVGGNAYSCSTVNNVTVCTVPAGPGSITGAETIPADTNLSGGSTPQTVIIPTATLANYARGTGLLYSTGTPVSGVAGTGEQVLATYTIPASTLVAGRIIRIRASFTSGSNGNNKTFKCYFGASVITSGTLTDNGTNGSCEVNVFYTSSAATQEVYANMIHATTNITTYVAAGTDNAAATIVAKISGQGGTSGVDVTMNTFSVELLGQ